METKFKIGDTVQLKSGGPKMTVTVVDVSDKGIHTTWFAGSKKESGYFPYNTITIIKEETKP